VKRIYVEIDNLALLVAWLKTRPAGECQVMIGSDTHINALEAVMNAVTGEGRDLARWLLGKLQVGEMTIKVSPKIADMPQGVELG
jgi:hypothetical protein